MCIEKIIMINLKTFEKCKTDLTNSNFFLQI